MTKVVKVVLIGDTNVGKTSLLNRYFHNSFDQFVPPSIGFDTEKVEYLSTYGQNIQINFFDTAGQEQYRTLTPFSLRNASMAMLFFDLTNESTLENLDFWKSQVIEYSIEAKLLVIGTKSDLISSEDIMSRAQAKFPDIPSTNFFPTSSKTGENVDSVFDFIKGCFNDEDRMLIPPPDINIKDNNNSLCC